ncbi:RagB/SusD family nutrient uptake outer membrane protein [Pedobacter gandavensis]|uniref:RagB/SusD family nutrient uptake outer membrane protein n=1 Tax=Pedobacter gandavensis TaxID=2679963 RepID=A0ABR6F1I1_9SPHI|nr:RagB/SusD family nutrient uptake outer membrane protein [Pedobacter gandavensis]MBB2151397.1 RagB/SusD family nutrient uptake outer membrane protein [Pedobacter gandavensis]
MKKILYLPLVVFALSIQTSCKKSSLDRVPQDQISSATFWTSQNEARLALNGCYGYLNGGYSNVYDDGSSDNAYAQYPWESTATSVSAGDIDATLDLGYNSRYVFIRKYNYFLDNVDKVPMEDVMKRRFIAEARALRAITYFDLARTFGAVPLLTKSYVDPQETAVAPTAEADVIAFCLAELTSAAVDLPATYVGGTGNETGRITSGATWAIKSRIQMYYGKWADAVASTKVIMGMGYKLFRVTAVTPDILKDDYSSLVTFADAAEKEKFYKGLASYEQQFWTVNENSKEVILASQSITNSSYEYGNGLRTLLPPSDLGGWSSITPTQELVNAYWDKTGHTFAAPTAAQRATNYNNGKPTTTYFDEFKNRDTRLYASVLFPSNPWNSFNAGYTFTWGRGGNNNSKTGYNFKKMVDPAYIENDWDGAQDFPIIRYAEILLSYAEAQNEVSGPDASVYDALNDVRDRSGMPTVDQTVFNSKETVRELIRNERRIELAGEGQRNADIRRWNIGKNVMKSTYDLTNSIVQERNWQDKFKVMPYPQSALDHNANLKAAQSAKGY